MSNIIPIVSSSPPPLDDGCGWDDDDEEDFGNFASAPSDCPNQSSESTFPVDWSSETFHSIVAPKAQLPDIETGQPTVNCFQNDGIPSQTDVVNGNSESRDEDKCVHNGSNREQDSNDNFCKPFAVSFDEEASHIPITSEGDAHINCVNSQSETAGLSVSHKHASNFESTQCPATVSSNINLSMISTSSTIDSGVYSPETDLSPLSHPDSYPSKDKAENCDNLVSDEEAKVNSDGTVKEVPVSNDAGNIQSNCNNKNEEEEGWGNFNEAAPSQAGETESLSLNTSLFDDAQAVESVLPSVGESSFCDPTEVKSYENEQSKNDLSCEEDKLRQQEDSNVAETDTIHSKVLDHYEENTVNLQSSSSSEEVREDHIKLGRNSLADDLTAAADKDADKSHPDSLSLEENISEAVEDFESSKSTSSVDIKSSSGQSVPCDLESNSNNTHSEFKESFSHISGDDDSINSGQEAIPAGSEKRIVHSEGAENVVDDTSESHESMKFKDVETVKSDSEDDKEFGDFSSIDEGQKMSDLTFRASLCEDDVGEEEGEIKTEKSPTFEYDDDFGDFDAFNSNEAAEPSEKADFDSDQTNNTTGFSKIGGAANDSFGNLEGSAVLADEDDFGDFDEAGTTHAQDAGWADFGNTPADVTQQESVNLSSHQPDVALQSTLKVDQSKGKVLLAVEKCFPSHRESSLESESQIDNSSSELEGEIQECRITALDVVVDLGIVNPEEAKQQTWTVVQHPGKKDPRVVVWSHLKDVDSSSALGYTWSASHGSKEVFSTLHIDTQNILFTQKKQAVPFFASGLGILEPTRGGNTHPDSKKEKSTLQSTLLDTSANTKQVLSSESTTPQDIPPVDFDWSVSGLTNPLTANTLDLDFLVVQGSDSCEKTADEWDWVFRSDTEDSSTSRSGLQSLEEMLKKSKPTAKLATHEVLSPEAEKVLAKIPDLSFMQSKVLMFPVKQ